jgi:glucose-6-phosphate 1-epimerase
VSDARDGPSAFSPIDVRAADGAGVRVLPYGAHVVSWSPTPAAPGGAAERLFVSERSAYRPGAAVRGGIPVIFPQFAAKGPFVRHGFARTRPWTAVEAGRAPDGAAEAAFALADDAETRALWPHAFRCALTVRAAAAWLEVTLAVENPGPEPFAFTGALHTYLRLGDVGRARVRGLEDAGYRDQAAGGTSGAAERAPLQMRGEVDRVYTGALATGAVEVDDPALARRTRVTGVGFPDVVVWNPGAALAAGMADLEPGGWERMLCVEAAAVGRPVVVAPGERWVGRQRVDALPWPVGEAAPGAAREGA